MRKDPVNSDFNFADSGRTEAFDDPYVNSAAMAICRAIVGTRSNCVVRMR